MIIYDRLYGSIDCSDADLKLFQTKEFARLNRVSLSAIPPWTLPCGVCASKAEHSIGVGHLARIVGARKDFTHDAHNLYFAALAHDLATPPFSHASEYFQIKLAGKNHEEMIDEVLEGSDFAKEIKNQGGNIDLIKQYVKGENPPLSDIINGSIDLDNLDNSLRWGISTGVLQKKNYNPESIAKGYALRNNSIELHLKDPEQLHKWDTVRKEVYAYVYGDTHETVGSMVIRALSFARREGELTSEYFTFTDSEAYDYLSTRCNPLTRTLMDRLTRWIFYLSVFTFIETDVSDTLGAYLLDTDNRAVLADAFAQHVSIPLEDVHVYTGKNKGYKKIHVPIYDLAGKSFSHIPQNDPFYILKVFIHPKHQEKKHKISEFVTHTISSMQ